MKHKIYPKPKELTYYGDTSGVFAGKISLSTELDSTLPIQTYILKIGDGSVSISGGSDAAVFMGTQTVKQLEILYAGELPSLYIKDWPDVENRGFMLDISRGKIPTMDSIYQLIDMMALLKFNQLQLYMESPCFKYKAYEKEIADCETLSPEDVRNIDAYCAERFIHLVPNQNSFGHLFSWLGRKEFNHLTIPGGWDTLDPDKPESLEFLANLYDSLLPNFRSTYLNVGCDEVPVDDPEKYFTFLMKIYDMVKERNHTMMFWGDIILNHPEYLERLPKDLIPLAWGYRESLEDHCHRLHELGFHYYACPGTSSWNTVFGDPARAAFNMQCAVKGVLNDAGDGVLLTDWGDNGHSQFFVASYPEIALFAGLCWNYKIYEDWDYGPSVDFLDKVIFKMEEGSFASYILEAGRMFPKRDSANDNEPFLWLAMAFYEEEAFAYWDIPKAEEARAKLWKMASEVKKLKLGCSDGDIYIQEFCQGVALTDMLFDLFKMRVDRFKVGQYGIYDYEEPLKALKEKAAKLRAEHIRIWKLRNLAQGSETFWWWRIDRCFEEIERNCKAAAEKAAEKATEK